MRNGKIVIFLFTLLFAAVAALGIQGERKLRKRNK